MIAATQEGLSYQAHLQIVRVKGCPTKFVSSLVFHAIFLFSKRCFNPLVFWLFKNRIKLCLQDLVFIILPAATQPHAYTDRVDPYITSVILIC